MGEGQKSRSASKVVRDVVSAWNGGPKGLQSPMAGLPFGFSLSTSGPFYWVSLQCSGHCSAITLLIRVMKSTRTCEAASDLACYQRLSGYLDAFVSLHYSISFHVPGRLCQPITSQHGTTPCVMTIYSSLHLIYQP